MKMKGIVYREFFLSRKMIVLEFVFAFIIMVMGILTRLSILYGNMAKLDSETLASVNKFTYYFFIYIPVIIMGCPFFGIIETTVADFQGRWMQLQYTMPVSESRWVGAKLIKNGILSLTAVFTGIVNAFIIKSISEKKITMIKSGEIKIFLIIIVIMYAISCVLMFMACRYKSYNGVIVRALAGGAAVYICFMMYIYRKLGEFMLKYKGASEESEMAVFFMKEFKALKNMGTFKKGIIFAAVCAVPVLMYMLTVRQLKRREKR